MAAPPGDDARAILEKRCLNCHGQAQTSGLDLRQIDSITKGGKRGPAIVPGNAEQSLLFKAVARSGELQMPPGKPLYAEEIATIRSWIDAGAPWGSAAAKEPNWWSFRKVVRPAVPTNQQKNPIDAFILSQLQQKGLKPVAAADKRTLVRRAYYDLHGLPPAPAQVAEFVNDASPDAYDKLLDRLLASPRYGERWGRHWLDVVRYADTGGFETDMYYANAWRYRDYVIKSLNTDKPYNQFVQEQIAGDEIWPDNLDLAGGYGIPAEKLKHLEARIGTALYTIGPTYHEAALNGEQLRYEWLADAVDTTGEAFLGLTLGCSRCHDHKFDPLSQRDYHRMMAVFAGSEEREVPVVDKMSVFGFKSGYTSLLQVDEYKAAIQRLDAKVQKRAINEVKSKFPADVVAAYDAKSRSPQQAKLAAVIEEALAKAGLRENASGKNYKPQYTADEKEERDRLIHDLGEAALKARYSYETATVLGHAEIVPEVHMTSRGDFHGTGPKVGPGFPKILGGVNDIDDSSGTAFVPQRRRALALWLTQPEHPLTARVMVNRLWAWHFGRGIVGTPNDFGRQGDPPSNPELLDWLASEFMQQGWSLKKIHRLIMLSDTYRRSSQFDEANAKIDSGNRYLWRMNRQRMDAEALRDSALAVAGALNLKMGGRSVVPPLTDEEKTGMWALSQWPVSLDPAEHNRRSVYLHVKRSFPYPMFAIFDSPESSVSYPRRDVTTVAPQALALFNSKFMLTQAGKFAERVQKEHPGNPDAAIEGAWELALGRSPTRGEKEQAQRFLSGENMANLCLVLLNMNEFLYVE